MAAQRPGGRSPRQHPLRPAIGCLLFALSVLLPVAQSVAAEGAVGALGRIGPRGGFVAVSGPGSANVARVLAARGDSVTAGQELAVLATRRSLHAAADLARLELQRLRAVNALQARALELELEAAEQSLKLARSELDSYLSLGKTATSARERRRRDDQVGQARVARSAARVALDLHRTRAVHDGRIAEHRLREAEAARAGGAIRAPVAGTVMEVAAMPGAGARGELFTLADLSAIEVVCDVFEADLGRIRVGSPARVKSPVFAAPLTGTVSRVGRRVAARSKVGKVWVALDAVAPADRYLGMEVNVEIDL